MFRVEVLVPFHMAATDTDHVPGDVIEVSEDQLANIRAVNINMVLVLGEVEQPKPEQPKKRKKKQ